jgi:hypothetical protein
MTVTFANQNALEIEAIGLMGVHVKVTKNPFGYFGTGLKFAIATLLRTGHTIQIFIKGKQHMLTLTKRTVRDVDFDVITLDGKELGYTTEVGKNWQIWQAYRELSCNATDEVDGYVGFDHIDPDQFDTIIRVSGKEIDQVHRDRRHYFCESKVLQEVPGIGEIREGETQTIFYRGVAVITLEKPMMFTYNLYGPITLTEDRTMANNWILPSTIGKFIAAMEKHDMVAAAILCRDKYFEYTAEFGAVTHTSKAFLDVMAKNAANFHANVSAKKLWNGLQPKEDPFKPIEIDDIDSDTLVLAHHIAKKCDKDFDLTLEEVHIVGYVGEGVLGLYKDGKVYLSREAFKLGKTMVAAVLYEEWLHRERGFADESREMQNHLIKQLMSVAERLR